MFLTTKEINFHYNCSQNIKRNKNKNPIVTIIPVLSDNLIQLLNFHFFHIIFHVISCYSQQ